MGGGGARAVRRPPDRLLFLPQYNHVFHEHLLDASCVPGTGDTKTNRTLGKYSVWLGEQPCKRLNSRVDIIIEACRRDLKITEEEVQNSACRGWKKDLWIRQLSKEILKEKQLFTGWARQDEYSRLRE